MTKNAKSLITKSIEAKTDIELVLLNWRNTPNKIGTSSTQRCTPDASDV
jgi:hypothetical protein